MQSDHGIDSVYLARGIVGKVPLLEKFQCQRQGRRDPARDHGVAQQGGEVVANSIENAKGQSHEKYAVFVKAEGRDIGWVIQAEGGHGGGDAGTQTGHAQK